MDHDVARVLTGDACDLPTFNSFWVFAAATTNIEMTLSVTDTQAAIGALFAFLEDRGIEVVVARPRVAGTPSR